MGKKTTKKGAKKALIYYSEGKKHLIIQDYLSSGWSKQAVWQKHTGLVSEHGQILKWMRELGYGEEQQKREAIFAANNNVPIMVVKEPTSSDAAAAADKLLLEQRISVLERQLNEAEMKVVAFSTLVDIAEKEFGIPIRKKSVTKP